MIYNTIYTEIGAYMATKKIVAKKAVSKTKVKTVVKPKVPENTVTRTVKNKNIDPSIVKALSPKDPDLQYMGSEPVFSSQPESRKVALMSSFNWYSKFYGRKDAKELLCQYLELTGSADKSKQVRKADDNQFMTSIAWLARMSLRGLVLTESEKERIDGEVAKLIQSVITPDTKVSVTGGKKEVVVKESNRPNVQEIMRDRTREAAGEIEGMLDDYILSGAKANFNFKPIDELAKKNVLPQHISILTDTWKKKRNEIDEVIRGKDKQLSEAYSHYNKTQLKNLLKFIDQFLSDFNSYVSIKKTAKAPRARKAVPVEKQVSKLKYLKAFKDDALKLDLVGLHPVKLHGASEAWVFDTAKRKLHHYIADEYSKTFTVKGNTLLGFDKSNSEIKTLRKPNEQLKEIMGSKPAARKYFKDIRAVSVAPNGRFNESMLILKAW